MDELGPALSLGAITKLDIYLGLDSCSLAGRAITMAGGGPGVG